MEEGGRLAQNRAAWNRKPGLRLVYESIYRRIGAALVPGRTLEIGAGTGNFKEFAPDAVATDIQFAPWLDLIADAHQLPLEDDSVDNVVMVDVLHHLPRPLHGLTELARVLRPGGRIVLAEPAITPGSSLFYRYLHREPVDFSIGPFSDAPLWDDGDPYAANQAIPTLLFVREIDQFARAIPELRLHSRQWLNLLAYPLSGGFQRWTLLSAAMTRSLLALEERLTPTIGRLMGFRILVILEKTVRSK